ncbi:MAG: hypothetical protein ABEJ31_08035 [Haloarculaceae archaeon]
MKLPKLTTPMGAYTYLWVLLSLVETTLFVGEGLVYYHLVPW